MSTKSTLGVFIANLEWEPTPNGHESAGFRIRRLDGRPAGWRLETLVVTGRHGGQSPTTSIHASLREAKRRAQRDEEQRVRLARVRGHVAVGVVAGIFFVVLFTSSQSLGGFVAAMFFLYAALRSLVDAVAVLLGESWTRDPGGLERLDWSDRIVLAAVEGLRKRELAAGREEGTPAIMMLPPDQTA